MAISKPVGLRNRILDLLPTPSFILSYRAVKLDASRPIFSPYLTYIDFALVRSRPTFMSFDNGGPVKRLAYCGEKWEREKPRLAPGLKSDLETESMHPMAGSIS